MKLDIHIFEAALYVIDLYKLHLSNLRQTKQNPDQNVQKSADFGAELLMSV